MAFRSIRRFGEPFPRFGEALSPDRTIAQLIAITQPSNLIGYWPLGDKSGTTADDISPTNADGSYVATVTLAQPGIGDGSLSVLFNGSTARIDLSTNLAAIDTAMGTHTKGTIVTYSKVSAAGVWTDGTADVLAEFGADANNRVFLEKDSTNNTLTLSHRAGGTAKTINITASPTGWFMVAITWDKVADEVKVYYNGAQSGATQTGLGVWAGSLAATFSGIADFRSTAPSTPWNGWLAHVALWKVALSAAEIKQISPAVYFH